MIDPKVTAEVMDCIIESLTRVCCMALRDTVDDPEAQAEKMKVAAELGNAIGAAAAVKLQCERAGKPKTRGAAE